MEALFLGGLPQVILSGWGVVPGGWVLHPADPGSVPGRIPVVLPDLYGLASLGGDWASGHEAALTPSGLLHAVSPRPQLQDAGPTRDWCDHEVRPPGCCRSLAEDTETDQRVH